MTLYFLNNIFLLDLPLEPAKRVFERLAILQPDFSQLKYTSPLGRDQGGLYRTWSELSSGRVVQCGMSLERGFVSNAE